MTTRSSKLQRYGCLIICLIIFMFPALIVIQLFIHNCIREHAELDIGDGTHKLMHSRIGSHPMMAEYSRDITFITNGVEGQTRPLSMDTCGGYPINCYLIENNGQSFLRMDDATAEHLLDLENQIVYLIVSGEGFIYVGQLDSEDASSSSRIVNNDPATLTVTVGGNKAFPISDLTNLASEKYIGRFDGKAGGLRFISADESDEIKIRHLFED